MIVVFVVVIIVVVVIEAVVIEAVVIVVGHGLFAVGNGIVGA